MHALPAVDGGHRGQLHWAIGTSLVVQSVYCILRLADAAHLFSPVFDMEKLVRANK